MAASSQAASALRKGVAEMMSSSLHASLQRTAELRTQVYALADELKLAGHSRAQAGGVVKELANDCGLPSFYERDDDLLAVLVGWCVERFDDRDNGAQTPR